MVVIKNPQDYKFIEFRKSKSKNKKYDAILLNKKTNRTKTVSFGDKRYQHYFDRTPLNLYSKLNHNDKKRRQLFRKRTKKNAQNKYSSAYFAYKWLW